MSLPAHEVTFVNLDRVVRVPDNANLREVCLREGIRLYRGLARLRNCEGRARCGTCRVRIVDGGGNLSVPTPGERRRMGDAADGAFRLACQANVRGPVSVEV